MKQLFCILLLVTMLAGCSEKTSPTKSEPPAVQFCDLHVVVHDSSGHAVPQTHVDVYTRAMILLDSDLTDSTGALDVDSLRPDTVRIQISRLGFVTTSREVALTDAQQEVRIILAPYGGPYCSLHLMVQDTAHSAIPGAKLTVLAEGDTLALGYSDSTGLFLADSLQPVSALIQVWKLGYTATSRQFWLNPGLQDEPIYLTRAVPSDRLNFVLTTLDGTQLNGHDLIGRVVIIDFWATWCTPCKEQLESFRVLDSLYWGGGLTIIGVAYQDDSTRVQNYVHAHNLTFPMAMATDDLCELFGGITSVPASYVFNRNGEGVRLHLGQWSLERWTQEIMPLLYP